MFGRLATRLLAMRRATLGGRAGVAFGELPSGVLGQSTSNIMLWNGLVSAATGLCWFDLHNTEVLSIEFSLSIDQMALLE